MGTLTNGDGVQGLITSFDEHVGLGEMTLESGEILPFHCINIADGTRTIAPGTAVQAEVFWHPRGRFEARDITPAP